MERANWPALFGRAVSAIENNLSGGEGTSGTYGTLSAGSARAVCDSLSRLGVLGSPDACLLDVGSGIGRMAATMAAVTGLSKAVLVEMDRVKMRKTVPFVCRALSEVAARGLTSRRRGTLRCLCVLREFGEEAAHLSGPATVAFAYWQGFSQEDKARAVALLNTLPCLGTLVLVDTARGLEAPMEAFQKAGWVSIRLDDEPLVLSVTTSGGGEQKQALFMQRAAAVAPCEGGVRVWDDVVGERTLQLSEDTLHLLDEGTRRSSIGSGRRTSSTSLVDVFHFAAHWDAAPPDSGGGGARSDAAAATEPGCGPARGRATGGAAAEQQRPPKRMRLTESPRSAGDAAPVGDATQRAAPPAPGLPWSEQAAAPPPWLLLGELHERVLFGVRQLEQLVPFEGCHRGIALAQTRLVAELLHSESAWPEACRAPEAQEEEDKEGCAAGGRDLGPDHSPARATASGEWVVAPLLDARTPMSVIAACGFPDRVHLRFCEEVDPAVGRPPDRPRRASRWQQAAQVMAVAHEEWTVLCLRVGEAVEASGTEGRDLPLPRSGPVVAAARAALSAARAATRSLRRWVREDGGFVLCAESSVDHHFLVAHPWQADTSRLLKFTMPAATEEPGGEEVACENRAARWRPTLARNCARAGWVMVGPFPRSGLSEAATCPHRLCQSSFEPNLVYSDDDD